MRNCPTIFHGSYSVEDIQMIDLYPPPSTGSQLKNWTPTNIIPVEVEIISNNRVIIDQYNLYRAGLPNFNWFLWMPTFCPHNDGNNFSHVERHVKSQGSRIFAELCVLLFYFFPPVQCHLWTGIPGQNSEMCG